MTPILRIHFLGEFRLFFDNQPLDAASQQRLQALLAYLLLHRNTAISRKQIAFCFWPDSTEAQALTNLRKLIFSLRQALPQPDDFLLTTTQGVEWRKDAHFTFDVAELERVLDQLEQEKTPEAATVEQVMTLYRGELLPACYDDWLLSLRYALHMRVVRGLEKALVGLEACHEYQLAQRLAEYLLRLDPLQENTYRQLMRMRALAGDRSGALRAYYECVTALEQELEVSPAHETQILYQQLLKAEPPVAPAPTPEQHLRRDHIPLVGRKVEWQALQDAWQKIRNRRPHLLTIWGEAGIGKTRLLEELLHWARLRPGTAVYARAYAAEGALSYGPLIEWLRNDMLYKGLEQLETLWQTELARLLPELLIEHPNLPPPAPMNETWQRLRFYEAFARAVLAAPAPCLLLLDDLQWVDAETLSWLRYLLHFDPQASLLVVGTVRSEAVNEEHTLNDLLRQLQREQQCLQLELAPLSLEETTTLAAHLTEAEPFALATQLYRETEGNPLFIVETVRAGLLRDAAQETQPGTLPPTVQAVIGARLAQLSPLAHSLTHLAATVGRAFSAAILAAASDLDEDALVQGLDELWRKRLVREQGEGYDFSHDKIREVAYSQMSRERRRLLHRRVAQALESLSGHEVDTVSGQIAAHWEAAGDSPRASHFFQRAGAYAAARLANIDAIRYFGWALNHLPKHDQARRYEILLARVKLLNGQGRREEERADLAALQKLVRSFPDSQETTRRQAEVTLYEARYLFNVEDQRTRTRAKIVAQEAIHLAEKCQAIELAAQAYWVWGATAFWDNAGYLHARTYMEKSRQLAQMAGMQRDEAMALLYLAMLELYGGGQVKEIEKLTRESLALHQSCGDKAGEAFMLGMLAYMIITQAEGRYPEAIGYCQRALAFGTETIGWDAARFALSKLGYCYYLLGNAAQGLADMEQDVSISRQAESLGSTAAGLWGLASLYIDLGEYAKAQELSLAALQLLQESGSYPYQAKIFGLLALIHHALGEPAQARDYGEQAVSLAKTLGDPRLEATASRRLGRALVAQNESVRAKELFQRALLLHNQMEQYGQAMQALAGLAEVALQHNQVQEALDFIEQILAGIATRQLDATDEVLYIYQTCYEVLRRAKDPRAMQLWTTAHDQVQARAATIPTDSLRLSFWAVAAHRAALVQS